jgi:hypothetical protein
MTNLTTIEMVSQLSKDETVSHETVAKLLQYNKLKFEVQSSSNNITNYLVLSDTKDYQPLFTAHIDKVSGSSGANDNSSSVAVLIHLAKIFKEKGIPASFAFLDGEEQGSRGASLFADLHRNLNFSVIFAVDITGFGNTVAFACRRKKIKRLRGITAKHFLFDHHAVQMHWLPPGDDAVLSKIGAPTYQVNVLPEEDIQAIKAFSNEYGFLAEKAPSYALLIQNLEVMSTMHMGWRDSLEYVSEDALNLAETFLFDILEMIK